MEDKNKHKQQLTATIDESHSSGCLADLGTRVRFAHHCVIRAGRRRVVGSDGQIERDGIKGKRGERRGGRRSGVEWRGEGVQKL